MGAAEPLIVRATWDDEAEVWVAISDDVPGLATEAESLDALVAKLKIMIPELLDANGYIDSGDVPFLLHSELSAIAYRQAA